MHPPLTKTQRDVLTTLSWEKRDDRIGHPTLNYLRALGLAACEPIMTARDRPSVAVCRWSITELGREVRASRPGTPVPLPAAKGVGRAAPIGGRS